MDHGVDVQVVKSQDNFDPNFSSVESPNPENKALSERILRKEIKGRCRYWK